MSSSSLLPLYSLTPTPSSRRLSTSRAAMATTTYSSSPSTATPKRVVVCGGGVIGACTAFFLSSAASELGVAASPPAPVEVTLVERASVACAASGKAGGFLALDWCDGGAVGALARASYALHRSLAGVLDGAEAYGYRPIETLSVAVASGAEDGLGRRKKSSISSSSLPPWVDGPAHHPRTIGMTDTTAQVHPQLFTRKLVESAVGSGGVKVVKGEVQCVDMDGDRAVGVGVQLESGEVASIAAEAVVLAMGPWSDRLPLISSLFTVSGLKAHSIVLRPSNPSAITAHALFLSYAPSGGGKTLEPEVYPRPTGEVYICGMSKDEEVPDDPEQIFGDSQSIAMLHKIAGTVSSQLVTRSSGTHDDITATVVAEQACFLPCTNDGIPVIGELPGAKGCFVGTGHSCWGILNGPATGAALAELITTGQSTIVDLTPFSPARFVRHGRSKATR